MIDIPSNTGNVQDSKLLASVRGEVKKPDELAKEVSEFAAQLDDSTEDTAVPPEQSAKPDEDAE